MEQQRKNEDIGAIIGVIIVIIVLLFGAFYFAGQRIQKSKEFKASIQEQLASTTSDELTDIETSANSMNLDELGIGIENL